MGGEEMIVEHPHEALRQFPVVVSLSVEWGDQDSFAHVNNTVYLKWCETARVVYLERVGMWPMIKNDGMGPILASISCDYRQPVVFPDTVQVGARVSKIGRSSFRMEHAVVSVAQNVVVAESHSTLVFIEYKHGKSLPLPKDIRLAMERLEGRPLS
ncbi:MAG: acyl-CoA thioesterase [Bryobacteraceae bacterium]